ncbi:Uncharacterised protein [Vibrio cholerae]|nr:Uncharacterised protein [Vibrio cholerae]
MCRKKQALIAGVVARFSKTRQQFLTIGFGNHVFDHFCR